MAPGSEFLADVKRRSTPFHLFLLSRGNISATSPPRARGRSKRSTAIFYVNFPPPISSAVTVYRTAVFFPPVRPIVVFSRRILSHALDFEEGRYRMRLFALDIARYGRARRAARKRSIRKVHMDKCRHIRTPLDIHILNGQV